MPQRLIVETAPYVHKVISANNMTYYRWLRPALIQLLLHAHHAHRHRRSSSSVLLQIDFVSAQFFEISLVASSVLHSTLRHRKFNAHPRKIEASTSSSGKIGSLY